MLQHTQAMAPFCFRMVRAACIVDSPDGMTAVPMSFLYLRKHGVLPWNI